MKLQRLFILAALTCGFVLRCAAATTPLYENAGTTTNSPVVDANVFVNSGLFSASSLLPYETTSTLVYTNKGIMAGIPGFRLETVSLQGARKPASLFYNDFGALVESQSLSSTLIIAGGAILTASELPQVIINASNIVNRGSLRTGLSGLVRLTGNSVDLTRSDAGIEPAIVTLGSFTPTNFVPDFGIFDLYWGMNNTTMGNQVPLLSPGGLAADNGDGTFSATTPGHQVTNQLGPFGNALLSLSSSAGFVLTNAFTPTNWLVQMVFVQNADPNMTLDVRFTPSTILTNPYTSPIVQLTTTETNVLDASNFLREIYITDFMAAETNFTILTNLVSLNTFRPSTYNVTRLAPAGFLTGAMSNAVFSADLIANAGYTNAVVTNRYSAYSFQVDNVQMQPPVVPGVMITDIESRVEITANELNLNQTRIRSDGLVKIKTSNLLGTPLTSIDSPNLILDLAKPEGTIQIAGMVKEFVERTAGVVNCWSGMWTNLWGSFTTNSMPDPNDPTMMTNVITTNVIEIGFHVFVVDSQLVRDQPVSTHAFSAKSDEVLLDDVIRTTNVFLVDAEKLTVNTNGRVELGAFGQTLTRTDFPRLTSFENRGSISLGGTMNLGTDRGAPYESILNTGTMTAFQFDFSADTFMNSGFITTDGGLASIPGFAGLTGAFNVRADAVRFEGGAVAAGDEITIITDDLKILGAMLSTPDRITLSIQNSISEAAEVGDSIIACRGFSLPVKPATGDFLATTITSTIPKFLAIDHVWSGEDRGASPDGYKDNAAVGRLVLVGDLLSLFRFRGASAQNALYVDFLELQGSAMDIVNALEIDSSLVIYFADSNLVPEDLDGLFDGRLRWVPDYVGMGSGAAVQSSLSDQMRLMNRALRESLTFDTDLDGIVNGLDVYPLDADTFRVSIQSVSNQTPASLTLSWMANPESAYVIEYTTDLTSNTWFPIGSQTNSAQTSQPATTQVRLSSDEPQRYFRVRLKP